MSSLVAILSDAAHYDGYLLQAYLLENIDLIGYCASFYLVMVGKGSTILSWFYKEKSHARSTADLASQLTWLYTGAFVFHVLMTLVLAGCVAVVAPMLNASLQEKGLYTTACAWNDALVYTGPAGLALSVVTLAKIAELMSTVVYTVRDFLLNKNTAVATDGIRHILVQTHNTINPPHWWYASLVALFFWHTYSVGVSTYPMIACVSAALRAASNAAMAMEDLSMRKKLSAYVAAQESEKKQGGAAQLAHRSPLMKALGVLPGVNMLLECVVCSVIAIYSSYQNYTAAEGCAIMQANVRMCVAMYLSALGLAVYQLVDMQKAKKSTAAAVNGEKKRQ